MSAVAATVAAMDLLHGTASCRACRVPTQEPPIAGLHWCRTHTPQCWPDVPADGFAFYGIRMPAGMTDDEICRSVAALMPPDPTLNWPAAQVLPCCTGRYVRVPRKDEPMRVSDAFGSYLKCENLHGKRVLVTIDRVDEEKIGDDKKFVIYFRGKDRGLVLNVTNANSITKITGTDEMDEWSGHPIVLHPDTTMFGGKQVDCIRIAAPTKKGKAAPPPPPEDDIEFPADDGEAPPF